MFIRFSHVMIYAKNHSDTVQWYCKTLGFEIDYNAPGQYASLHHNQLGRLAVHATNSTESLAHGPMPYLLCDDIKGTLAALIEKGVQTTEPKREGESPWFASFSDPEGNVWGIEEA